MSKPINQELVSVVLWHWIFEGFTGGDFLERSLEQVRKILFLFSFSPFLRQAELFRKLAKEDRMTAVALP